MKQDEREPRRIDDAFYQPALIGTNPPADAG